MAVGICTSIIWLALGEWRTTRNAQSVGTFTVHIKRPRTTIGFLDGTQFDFGEVVPDQTLRSSFPLKNLGPESIDLGTLRTTCSRNLRFRWNRELVAPGEVAELEIVVKAHGNGEQRRQIPFIGSSGILVAFRPFPERFLLVRPTEARFYSTVSGDR